MKRRIPNRAARGWSRASLSARATEILTPNSQLPTPNSFTLVELLMVIGIIAILASLLMVGANAVQKRAKRDNTRVLIERVETALAEYESEEGDLEAFVGLKDTHNQNPTPTDYARVVQVLQDNEAIEASEVDQNGDVVDYWGYPLRVKRKGENRPGLDVWSVGPDGQNGNEDDVVNWTRDWKRPSN